MTDRPYQTEGKDGIRAAFGTGKKAPIYTLGCAGGKTHVFAGIAHGARNKNKRVLICAHRRELLKQASKKLSEVGVEHGIIAPGFTRTRDSVQVGSIQTVGRRLDRIGDFDLLIIDECHHAVSGQYTQLIASQAKAKLLGVTASPIRLDGRGLGIQDGGVFDCMVEGPQACDLTADGYIKPIRVFAPATGPDLSGIKIRAGDYEKGALAEAMGKPTITGCAIDHYARLCPGWPAVVFCVSVQHAKDTAESFRAAGWRSVAADGSMSNEDREAALGGLVTGTVQVLCVCDLISEGLDIPGIAAVIFLRATKSLTNLIQWTGRGTRPVYAPNHDLSTVGGRKAAIAASKYPCCLVLDHAGVTLSLGMPDERREWSLEGRPKKEQAPPTKQCPTCFAIFSPAPVCPECGHSTATEDKAARELEVIAGELQEINAARLDALRRTPLAQLLTGRETLSELMEIQKTKGYKQGWAFHVIRERRERRGVAA